MKLPSILSEAWRNIVSGTSRMPLYAVLIALTAGLCAAAEVAAVHTIQNHARAFIDGGGSTRMLIAEDQIEAAACQALSQYDSVKASGALREAPDTPIDELAGAAFQTYEATPGFATLLGLSGERSQDGGAWVSEPFATSLGVQAGSELHSDGEALRIAGVFAYPDDGRDARLSYALVVPVAATSAEFDECWMRSWPEPPDADGILRTALSHQDSASTDVSLSQLNRGMGSGFDGAALFGDRLTRWAPSIALGAGLLVGFAQTRLRRLEHASALHAGQSHTAIGGTILIESLAWSVSGAVLAASAIYLGAGLLAPRDLAWTMSLALPPLVAGVTGALLGTLVGLSLVRESDLFRYFKER